MKLLLFLLEVTLIFGTPALGAETGSNPCGDDPSKPGPHGAECLQHLWLEAGCSPSGTYFPDTPGEGAYNWWDQQTVEGALDDMRLYKKHADTAISTGSKGKEEYIAYCYGPCADVGGCPTQGQSTVTTKPSPTPNPSTSQTPTAIKRTVIFLRAETSVGQNVFIRGGIDHGLRSGCSNDADTSPCAVDISHRELGSSDHYAAYNAWRAGDQHLDWYGAEPGQGTYAELGAEGTPLVWTSNNPSNPGYQPDNVWGDHYWKVEVDMNCDETEDGWFELKGFMTNGPGWESNISQGVCSGSGGGQQHPYTTANHFARCGYVNVFEWNSNTCISNNF